VQFSQNIVLNDLDQTSAEKKGYFESHFTKTKSTNIFERAKNGSILNKTII
jgi:hypothetical protein